jgi:hypothetical protein
VMNLVVLVITVVINVATDNCFVPFCRYWSNPPLVKQNEFPYPQFDVS